MEVGLGSKNALHKHRHTIKTGGATAGFQSELLRWFQVSMLQSTSKILSWYNEGRAKSTSPECPLRFFQDVQHHLVLTTISNLLYRHIHLLWSEGFVKGQIGNLMLTL